MGDTKYDIYFDIIDDSTAKHFLNKYGANTDVRENRFLRSNVINLIEPHLKDSKTILDVGVGQGVNSLFFLKNGYIDKLVGMDNDSKVLDMFLQNAEWLGVGDKVEAVELDVMYGVDTRYPPDCVLCMDMLYGNSSSVFGKNSGRGFLCLDNNLTVGALSDVEADKIIITRLCGCIGGTCKTSDKMEQDLQDTGYYVVDSGSKIYGNSAVDYAIAVRCL